jgi:hypothetical protein
MLFRLRIANAAGPLTTLPTVFASAEDAINTACATLRHGATDAWIEDDEGRKVADFAAIKKHYLRMTVSN